MTEEILRKAVKTGTLDRRLQKVEVHKGDTYFVPAGTAHGIGAGILIAEIQKSYNVTCRVYDYDRIDKNGQKRELHFDRAVQVMNMDVAPDASQNPRPESITQDAQGNYCAAASILSRANSGYKRILVFD